MSKESNFATRYCAQHGLRMEDYEAVVVKQALYGHARVIAPLLKMIWPDYFAADEEFVQNVGRLTRMRDFIHESEEFVHHPANHGFWRSFLYVRVSARKLRRIVRETIRPEAAGEEEGADAVSAAPFKGERSSVRGERKPKTSV